MKYVTALILALTFSTLTSASELNQNALDTLLKARNVVLDGDVHSYETIDSIYNSAVSNGAEIKNLCAENLSSKTANCILWITYSPIGETALEYSVNLPGTSLTSALVNVFRGD